MLFQVQAKKSDVFGGQDSSLVEAWVNTANIDYVTDDETAPGTTATIVFASGRTLLMQGNANTLIEANPAANIAEPNNPA